MNTLGILILATSATVVCALILFLVGVSVLKEIRGPRHHYSQELRRLLA